MSSALTAARQLAQRLTGGGQLVSNADGQLRLSQAVTLAVKAASRLRKAIVEAANFGCSAANIAVVADSLEGAALLLESTGGLKSAAGEGSTECRHTTRASTDSSDLSFQVAPALVLQAPDSTKRMCMQMG